MSYKKKVIIKPSYIKDTNGKTVEVYLDLKTYNAIIKQIDTFEKIKKENRIKTKKH